MIKNHNTTTSFDQQLTEALRPGPAPEDLRRSLLRAAVSHRSHRTWRALGIAATLMLFLGSGAWAWMARWNRHEGEQFSRAALQNFMEVQHLDFIAENSTQNSAEQCMERCRQWSAKAVGFQALLPKHLADQPLKGGCVCRMLSSQSACYFLQDGRAVYVFGRTLKGIDTVPEKAHVILASGHKARAWNEDGRGYVLVEPPGWKPGV